MKCFRYRASIEVIVIMTHHASYTRHDDDVMTNNDHDDEVMTSDDDGISRP